MKKEKKAKLPLITGKMTWGEVYGPAMKIKDPKEAKAYFEAIVKRIMAMKVPGKPKCTRAQAEKYAKNNLGYWSGYYDSETMQRVFKLYCCEHPVFGKIPPTPKEAFEAGEKLGKKIKAEQDKKAKNHARALRIVAKCEKEAGLKPGTVLRNIRKLAKKGRK